MFDNFKLIIICIIIGFVFGITFMCVGISFNKEEPVIIGEEQYSPPRAEDLAMYYEQYKIAEPNMKVIIGIIVALGFNNFDKEQLVNGALKQFLVNCRFRYKVPK